MFLAVGTLAALSTTIACRTKQASDEDGIAATESVASADRERALEKAFLAVTAADENAANAAIEFVEKKGAKPAQLQLLQSQKSFFSGDLERARVCVDQAIQLDPKNHAARTTQALIQLRRGDLPSFESSLRSLRATDAKGEKDLELLGVAQAHFDPAKALETMNEAVSKSDFAMTRAMRAIVYTRIAEDRSDISSSNLALSDIRSARDYFPPNQYIVSIELFARVVLANLQAKSGNEDVQRHELGRSQLIIRSLDRAKRPHLQASIARWVYYDQTEQFEMAYDVARKAVDDGGRGFAHYAISYLYRQGRFEEAMKLVDKAGADDPVVAFWKVCLLAEIHPDKLERSEAIAKQMATQFKSGESACIAHLALRVIGRRQEATRLINNLRDKQIAPLRNGQRWTTLLEFFVDELSESEAIQATENHTFEKCVVWFTAALNKLSVGDRKGARRLFNLVDESRLLDSPYREWSRAFLSRIDADANWPEWVVPAKLE